MAKLKSLKDLAALNNVAKEEIKAESPVETAPQTHEETPDTVTEVNENFPDPPTPVVASVTKEVVPETKLSKLSKLKNFKNDAASATGISSVTESIPGTGVPKATTEKELKPLGEFSEEAYLKLLSDGQPHLINDMLSHFKLPHTSGGRERFRSTNRKLEKTGKYLVEGKHVDGKGKAFQLKALAGITPAVTPEVAQKDAA